MGPEDRTKCWCYGPEPSHWAAGGRSTRGQHGPHSLCNPPRGQGTDNALSWGGRDHTDGQILGQLRPLAEEEEEDGAALAPRPAFPGMGSEELRLASFYDWPLSTVVPPELLAAAGFFHTGESRGSPQPFYACSLPCSLSCASDLGRCQNITEQLDLCWGGQCWCQRCQEEERQVWRYLPALRSRESSQRAGSVGCL